MSSCSLPGFLLSSFGTAHATGRQGVTPAQSWGSQFFQTHPRSICLCKDGCNFYFRGVFQWEKPTVFVEISLYLRVPSRSRTECPAVVDISGSMPLSRW